MGATVDRAEVARAATMIVAGFRGLLLDLLITGDRKRTRAALEQLADHVACMASGW